jgi:glutamate-1-semialdehyde 2,1-aminomutase
MEHQIVFSALAAGATAWAVPLAWRRIELSRAKHRSLAGHSRIARRLAKLLPGYQFSEEEFFACDGASTAISLQRKAGFDRLAHEFARQYRIGADMTTAARSMISDLRFTSRYRVPFPFADYVSSRIKLSSFIDRVDGMHLIDVDGNRLIDLTGSYGVNLFGNDFYKRTLETGAKLAGDAGTVLGFYHPCVLENAASLRQISGLDEVSFHMSGTEAVMQAVRLARYHTGRTHVVRFCGAYHGWWEDVQPGPGNPLPPRDTYTLRDMDERSLRVIASRRDIACVLVNPLQALHPNSPAPGDSSLVHSGRRAAYDRAAYTQWLNRLRETCLASGVVLIFDEVFLGFRLAPGGAQEYFGVKADMVTYGKTLGGGLPVGVVCGRADLMKRFREDRPADICFARGTFNAHPQVMGTMRAFLDTLSTPEVSKRYDGLDETWNGRAGALNRRLEAAALPVRVANMSSVWTITYTVPSRYNWMLQFYLRDQGLALSWVGSGRLIFSLDFSDGDFSDVCERFVAACSQMREDGWWSGPPTTNRSISRRIIREMFGVKQIQS